MFAIGDSLREARTRRGLSPADVQKDLRIRERYLTALEEEHWEQLPGEAYVKGFLRQYAEFLGLDGNLYIEEYLSRFLHRDEEPGFVPDSLAPRSRHAGLLRLSGVLAVVVATVAGLAAWQLGGAGKPAKTPIAPNDAAAAPLTPAAKAPAAKPVAAPKPTVAVVSATRGRSWVSVRLGDANGKSLYEGILEQGGTLRFGLAHKLWVRMGRPSLLDIRLGSRTIGGLPTAPSNLVLTRDGAG
jgi:cytoskeletal protein RodZ